MLKIFFGRLYSSGRFGYILYHCPLKESLILALINRWIIPSCLLPLIQLLPTLTIFFLF